MYLYIDIFHILIYLHSTANVFRYLHGNVNIPIIYFDECMPLHFLCSFNNARSHPALSLFLQKKSVYQCKIKNKIKKLTYHSNMLLH